MYREEIQPKAATQVAVQVREAPSDISLNTSMFGAREIETARGLHSTMADEMQRDQIEGAGIASRFRLTAGKAAAAVFPAVLGILYCGDALRCFIQGRPLPGVIMLFCGGMLGAIAAKRTHQDSKDS